MFQKAKSLKVYYQKLPFYYQDRLVAQLLNFELPWYRIFKSRVYSISKKNSSIEALILQSRLLEFGLLRRLFQCSCSDFVVID